MSIPADEYLAATVSLPFGEGSEGPGATHGTPGAGRWATAQEELVRRLRQDPRVSGVAVADALPRMEHPSRLVEAEGLEPPPDRRGTSTRVARVAVDFFASLDQSVLAGREFNAADLEGSRSAVIVNTTFVRRVLGGQNAIGRRIRFVPWGDGEPGPWKEIVGVVGHLGTRMISPEDDQAVYEPVAPGELESVRLGIHVGEDPISFAPTLRTVAGQVDPGLIVSVTGPLDEVYEGDWYLLVAMTLGAGLLVRVLLALAASGIYAIMSFAVAERTTEIGDPGGTGCRPAGADPRGGPTCPRSARPGGRPRDPPGLAVHSVEPGLTRTPAWVRPWRWAWPSCSSSRWRRAPGRPSGLCAFTPARR